MFLRVLAAGLLTASSALAADEIDYAGSADWSGAYAGVQLGTAYTTGTATLGAFSGALIPLDVSNGLFPAGISGSAWDVIGGATAGYNVQSGAFVGGVEVDVSLADIKVAPRMNVVDPNPAFPFTGVNTITTYETEIGTHGTARLRAGYSTGDMMVYATGGVAMGQVTNRVTLSLPNLVPPFGPYTSPDWSDSGVRFGYVYGGGVEKKLTASTTLKFEILALDFEDVTITATDPVAFPGESIAYRFSNQTFIGRIGLNIAF